MGALAVTVRQRTFHVTSTETRVVPYPAAHTAFGHKTGTIGHRGACSGKGTVPLGIRQAVTDEARRARAI